MTDKTLAFLEYSFLFDPADGWAHLYEFEQDLSKFFNERGLEVVVIKTIEGTATKRILYLRKADMPMSATVPEKVVEISPKIIGKPKSAAKILHGMALHTPSKEEKAFVNRKGN